MDGGIIRNFKLQLNKILINFLVNNLDKEKKQILSDVILAIKFSREAWNLVTKETIQNCFRHCNIIDGEKETLKTSAIETQIYEKILQYQSLIKLHEPSKAKVEFLIVNEMRSLEDQLATSEQLTIDEIIEMTKPGIVSEIEEIQESNKFKNYI